MYRLRKNADLAADQDLDLQAEVDANASGKVGGNRHSYFADARKPPGIRERIPGVAWTPGETPRFYCTWEAHHGSGRPNEVFFYFNVGEIRARCEQTKLDAAAIVLGAYAHALGLDGIGGIAAPQAVLCVDGRGTSDYFPQNWEFVCLSYLAGTAADQGSHAPEQGWQDYPSDSELRDVSEGGHSKARSGISVPGFNPFVMLPEPSPLDLSMPDLGQFDDWFARGEAPREVEMQPHIADAYYRIYEPLNRVGPVDDDDIDNLFDMLSKSAEHTVLVQDAYNAGIGNEDGADKLVADLVDYSSRIRGNPREGNLRNFIIYLLVRAGAQVAAYEIPIHGTGDESFRLISVYAPIKAGEPQLPVDTKNWFRLRVEDTAETGSLFTLHPGQRYTVSWFLEYLDGDEDRIEVLPARVTEVPQKLPGDPPDHERSLRYYNNQNAGQRDNPLYAGFELPAERTGRYRVIAAIAWVERLYRPGQSGPQRRHVHFVERECTAITVDDRMRDSIEEAPQNAYGDVTASYYAQSAFARMMPPLEVVKLRELIFAPAAPVAMNEHGQLQEDPRDVEAHFIRMDSPQVPVIRDGGVFTAQFDLNTLDLEGDVDASEQTAGKQSAYWYVITANASYRGPDVQGAAIDERLTADQTFVYAALGTQFAFSTSIPGDYAIVAVPEDDTRPVMYTVRVFDDNDQAATLAQLYQEQADKLAGYALEGVSTQDHLEPTPFVVNRATNTSLFPLCVRYMDGDTGKVEFLNMYVGSLDPNINWWQVGAGYLDALTRPRLIDTTFGRGQSVYDGLSLEHCLGRFANENEYLDGWIYVEFDPKVINPKSEDPPYRFPAMRTKGKSTASQWASTLGSVSLLAVGAGLATIFTPVSLVCFVVGAMLSLPAAVASLQANQLRDKVDQTMVWIDLAGIAACLVGLGSLGAAIAGSFGRVAAAGGARLAALQLSKVLGITEVAVSGIEALLVSAQGYSEINKILKRTDLDDDQKQIHIMIAMTNMLFVGGMWALGGYGELIGNSAQPTHGTRDGLPTHAGQYARARDGLPNETIDAQFEQELSDIVGDGAVIGLRALEAQDPAAAGYLIHRLRAELRRLRQAGVAYDDMRRQLSDWLILRLSPVPRINVADALATLKAQMSARAYRELLTLYNHYAAIPSVPAGGYAIRFIADLMAIDTADEVLVRLRALAILEFGMTRQRGRRLLAFVYRTLDGYNFTAAHAELDALLAHFADTGYQSAYRGDIERSLRAIYNLRETRIVRLLEVEVVSWGFSAYERDRLGEIIRRFSRADGSYDSAYYHFLQRLGDARTSPNRELLGSLVLVHHIASFGFSADIARVLVTSYRDYATVIRPMLAIYLPSNTLSAIDAAYRSHVDGRYSGGSETRGESRPQFQPQQTTPFPSHYAEIDEGLAWLSTNHPELYRRWANLDRARQLAVLVLARLYRRFPDLGALRGILERCVAGDWHALFSTTARQTDYDAGAARYREHYPGSPGHGDTVKKLPKLEGSTYSQLVHYLQADGSGWQLVDQFPIQSINPTQTVWLHGDGSVLRFDSDFRPDGTPVTRVSKGVMALDGEGRPQVPQLRTYDGQLYRIVDQPPMADGRVADHRSRVPADPTQARRDIRQRLEDLLGAAGATLTENDIEQLVTVWTRVTEVEIQRTPRTSRHENDARPPERLNPPPQQEPTSRRDAMADWSSDPPRSATAEDIIARRTREGVETTAADREALDDILSDLADRLDHRVLAILWYCADLATLRRLLASSDTRILDQVISIVAARTLDRRGGGRGFSTAIVSARPHRLPLTTDLAALERVVIRLGPDDTSRFETALTNVDDLELVATTLETEPERAYALLTMANQLANGQLFNFYLYSIVYTELGPDAFSRHSDSPFAPLVLYRDGTSVMTSAAHADDTPVTRNEFAGTPRQEHSIAEGGAATTVQENSTSFHDRGALIANSGFDVVLLPSLEDGPSRPPRPRSFRRNQAEQAAHDQDLNDWGNAINQQAADFEARRQARNDLLANQGLQPSQREGYLIDGRVFYAIEINGGDSIVLITDRINAASARGHARNYIIDLRGTELTQSQLHHRLQDAPPLLVENCLVIDDDGLHRVWPAGEAPEPLPRRPQAPPTQPADGSRVGFDEDTEDWLTTFVDARIMRRYYRLVETDPQAANALAQRLLDTVDTLGGRQIVADGSVMEDRLQRWFTAWLDDAPDLSLGDIVLELRQGLREDDFADLERLIAHYGSDLEADLRFAADIYTAFQSGGGPAATTRIRALMISEFGNSPLRTRRLLEPVYRELANGQFGQAQREFDAIRRAFERGGCQTPISAASDREIADAYEHRRERTARAIDLGSYPDFTEADRELCTLIEAQLRRPDGRHGGDEDPYTVFRRSVTVSIESGDLAFAQRTIWINYLALFGYDETIAGQLLDLGYTYSAQTRMALRGAVPATTVSQIDELYRRRTGREFDAPHQPYVGNPNHSEENHAAFILFHDRRGLVPTSAHRELVDRAIARFSNDYPSLAIPIARAREAVRRAFYTVVRLGFASDSLELAVQFAEATMTGRWADIVGPPNPNQLGERGAAAQRLDAFRGSSYPNIEAQLHAGGFVLVQSDNAPSFRSVWAHPDGSVVRFRVVTQGGAPELRASRGMMTLGPDGQPMTPALDSREGQERCFADTETQSRQPDEPTRSLLASTPAQAAIDIRARLADELPDGDAGVTDHDVQELVLLWSDITEVPVTAGDSPAQRALPPGSTPDEPQANGPSTRDRAPDQDEDAATQRDTDSTGGARSPESNTDMVDDVLLQRERNGVPTSAEDEAAIRAILAEFPESFTESMARTLWLCTSLPSLLEVLREGNSRAVRFITEVVYARVRNEQTSHPMDLGTFDQLANRIFALDGEWPATVFIVLDDWEGMVRLFDSRPATAEAFTRVAALREQEHALDIALYLSIYDRVGPRVFAIHSGTPFAPLVRHVHSDGLPTSLRAFDDTPITRGDRPLQVQHEASDVDQIPTVPPTLTPNAEDMFATAGEQLAAAGFVVTRHNYIDISQGQADARQRRFQERRRRRTEDGLRYTVSSSTEPRPYDPELYGYEVGGRLFSYAPWQEISCDVLSSRISQWAAQGSTRNVIIDLRLGPLSADDVAVALRDRPPFLIENCLVIDRSGVHHVYPTGTPSRGPGSSPAPGPAGTTDGADRSSRGQDTGTTDRARNADATSTDTSSETNQTLEWILAARQELGRPLTEVDRATLTEIITRHPDVASNNRDIFARADGFAPLLVELDEGSAAPALVFELARLRSDLLPEGDLNFASMLDIVFEVGPHVFDGRQRRYAIVSDLNTLARLYESDRARADSLFGWIAEDDSHFDLGVHMRLYDHVGGVGYAGLTETRERQPTLPSDPTIISQALDSYEPADFAAQPQAQRVRVEGDMSRADFTNRHQELEADVFDRMAVAGFDVTFHPALPANLPADNSLLRNRTGLFNLNGLPMRDDAVYTINGRIFAMRNIQNSPDARLCSPMLAHATLGGVARNFVFYAANGGRVTAQMVRDHFANFPPALVESCFVIDNQGVHQVWPRDNTNQGPLGPSTPPQSDGGGGPTGSTPNRETRPTQERTDNTSGDTSGDTTNTSAANEELFGRLVAVRQDLGRAFTPHDYDVAHDLVARYPEFVGNDLNVLATSDGLAVIRDALDDGGTNGRVVELYLEVARMRYQKSAGLTTDFAVIRDLEQIMGPDDFDLMANNISTISDLGQLRAMLQVDENKAWSLIDWNSVPEDPVFDIELHDRFYEHIGPDAYESLLKARDDRSFDVDQKALANAMAGYSDDIVAAGDSPRQIQPQVTGGPTGPRLPTASVSADVQAEAFETLARYGFDVSFHDSLPTEPGATPADAALRQSRATMYDFQGLVFNERPQYVVDGRVFEVLDFRDNPNGNNMSWTMSQRAMNGEARNFVLYMRGGSVNAHWIHTHLQGAPPALVENCFVIDDSGLHRVLPTSGSSQQLTPP